MPTFTKEARREIDAAVAYMDDIVVRGEPKIGCPNDADEITDEAFEESALFLMKPLASLVERIHIFA